MIMREAYHVFWGSAIFLVYGGLSRLPSNHKREWEIIIIGGGPAGLTAAIYGGRAGHQVLVMEKMQSGGKIASTDWVDNYPGFPEGIGGIEYGQALEKQALKFGAEVLYADFEKADLEGESKRIESSAGEFTAPKVILATGTEPRRLGIPGEKELQGHGVSQCSTCDGVFFSGKEVAVIGGGDAAADESLYLTRFARKVYLIHHSDRLNAVRSLKDKVLADNRIEILWNTEVQAIEGSQKPEGLKLSREKKPQYLPIDGVFISIGREANAELYAGLRKDEKGFIITDEEMRTSCGGVFAAGDIRSKSLRQVITAAADGAVAAYTAGKGL